MNLVKKHAIYFVLATILFELTFILGLCFAGGNDVIHQINIWMMEIFHNIRTDTGVEVMRQVTGLGNYEFILHITIILGLIMAVTGHIEHSLGIITGMALTDYLTGIMKNFFQVLRPEEFLVRAGGWSYPSGHTSGAMVLALMIIWAAWAALPCDYRMTRRVILCIAIIYAIAVSVSRIYLGVHWFSDIIGGILLAGAVALLMIGIMKPVIMKRKQICN